MKQLTLTVIIPCYNEGTRILNVIKAIGSSKTVTELIVVDDGSDLETKEVLKTLPSHITIITHKVNKGKTAAMKTGLEHSSSDAIIFVDADLTGFSEKNIIQLMDPLKKNLADMVLGVREFDVFYARVFLFSGPFTGERSFLRRTLMDHIELFSGRGYSIEASLNRYFFKHGRVMKVLMKGVGQTAKYEKIGLSGFIASINMSREIIKFVGFWEFIYQIVFVKKLKYFS